MSENGKITQNIFWLVYSKVFALALNLIVTVRVVNYFGASEYGEYAYAASVVAVLEIVITLVETRVTKKRYAHYPASFVIFNSTIAKLFLATVALICGCVFMFIYNGPLQFNIMLLLLLLNSLLTTLRFGIETHFEYCLQSKQTVISSNIASVAGAALQILAVYFRMSVTTLCYITAIMSILNNILLYVKFRKIHNISIVDKVDIIFIWNIIKESTPLAIAAAAATIYTQTDSIMLGLLMGKREVGIYAVGLKLFNVAQIAIVPVRTSLFPKQMELFENKKKYKQLYIETSCIMTWLCIAGILASYTILPPIFRIFFSAEYNEALAVFNINVFALLFIYNAVLRTGHYALSNNGKILMYTQVFCAVLNVGLNGVLITAIGMQGAAVATVVTQAVSLLLANYLFPGGKEIFWWQIQAFNPVLFGKTVVKYGKRICSK